MVQYADDCTLFRKIETQEDVDALQEDLNSVQIWCANNSMPLNAGKCKAMDLSRARSPLYYEYYLDGAILEYVDTQRVLGVLISSDLRWCAHTDAARAKASQVLSFAARNLHGCSPRVKRMAYLTLVKPHLTYGLPAWHPTTQENINKLSRVQNKSLRFIYGRHPPAPEMHKIMPLDMHLKYTDLLFFKKCVGGEIDFDARARITEGRVLRGDSSQHPRLQPPPARSVFGQRAFSFRVVKPWNDLPTALKDCPTLQFPNLCKNHLWQG
jgi:hypothetical protein